MTERGLFVVDNSGNITGEKNTAIDGIPVNKILDTVSEGKQNRLAAESTLVSLENTLKQKLVGA